MPCRDLPTAEGNSMGYEKKSKDRLRRERRSKNREEKRWVRKGGKVRVRFVCPLCGGAHSRAEHEASPQGALDAELDRRCEG